MQRTRILAEKIRFANFEIEQLTDFCFENPNSKFWNVRILDFWGEKSELQM